MRRGAFNLGSLLLLAILAASIAVGSQALAQFGGGGGIGGGGGGGIGGGSGGIGGGATGGTGGGVSGANGVVVDAKGVLRLQHFPDPGGQLVRKRIAEAKAHLNPHVAKASKLRKVSLNRLEAAVRAQLDQGKTPSDEMQCLAGLNRVRYVFYYPDTKDIVLAGPAEAWAADSSGRVCGIDSGRPVLQLQDLIVALRAFVPSERQSPVILCSIDPTPEGLARMQQFLRSVGSQITPGDTEMIVNGLRTNLGMQNIRVGGIAPNTHFAQVLLECDYRMKLIGIGLERPPVKMVSYVDRASPGNRNALQRWYFVPDYECVRETADGMAMEMIGNGVKLVNADEIVSADGSRVKSSAVDPASRAFTEAFTKKYGELAGVIPVYSQLRNCIDLAVAAAFIQEKDYYGKAGMKALFGDEAVYPVQTLTAPQQVESAVTSVFKGSTLVTPIGGGVHIEPAMALRESNLLRDDDGKVGKAREDVDLKNLKKDQWWWD
jgi:hypothetical protein